MPLVPFISPVQRRLRKNALKLQVPILEQPRVPLEPEVPIGPGSPDITRGGFTPPQAPSIEPPEESKLGRALFTGLSALSTASQAPEQVVRGFTDPLVKAGIETVGTARALLGKEDKSVGELFEERIRRSPQPPSTEGFGAILEAASMTPQLFLLEPFIAPYLGALRAQAGAVIPRSISLGAQAADSANPNFGAFRGFSRENFRESKEFISTQVIPAFMQKFGDAPIVSVFRAGRKLRPDDDILLEIHTAGWRARAEEIGLEFVGPSPGFGTLYKVPSIAPEVSPNLLLGGGSVGGRALPPGGRGISGGPPVVPPGTPLSVPAGNINNTFVGALREIESVIPEVVTVDGKIIRIVAGKLKINPSVLKDTLIGRSITAYGRQRISVEELTETAVSAALDVHGRRELVLAGTGRLGHVIPIDQSTGFFRGTSRPWQDVFSNPDAFNLSTATRAYIDDFLKVIEEIEQLRLEAGLKPRGTLVFENGKFYVPRQTKNVRGVELRRPSRPELQRHYEEALEGFQNGIRYDVDPRATLKLHVRQAYTEIANAQLSNVLKGESVVPKDLLRAINPSVIQRYDETKRAGIVAANHLRALQRQMRQLQVGPELPGTGLGQAADLLTGARRTDRFKLAADIRAAKANLATLRAAKDRARIQYTAALDSAKKAETGPGALWGRQTEDTIGIDLWHNSFFTRENADLLKAATVGGDKIGRLAQGTLTVTNYVRFLSAVGDFAAPFIQGLPLLTRNPVAWSRATAKHYEAFLDPTVQARYIRENMKTFQEMARHAIPIGDPEFFAALRQGGGVSLGKYLELLPKGAEARRLLQHGGRQSFGRFQSSYNSFLSVARAQLWQASKKSWQGTDAELAQWIRNMTGALDSRALGVGPSQRAAESVLLAFSPRLLRSTIALIGDMAKGGAVGDAARVSMRNLVGGATSIYIVTGFALGKSWAEIKTGLNPLNGKRFLSFEINGDWIGIGGQVRAITQLLARTTLEPSTLLSGGLLDNPIIAFWLSRGAVGVRQAAGVIELATGKDALPFENIDSLPDLLKHEGTSALPFAIQGRLEGEGWLSTSAGLVGARTSPETVGEKRNKADQQAIDTLRQSGALVDPETKQPVAEGTTMEDLDTIQKALVRAEPEAKAAQEAVEKKQRERGSAWQQYKDERDGIRNEYHDPDNPGVGIIDKLAEREGPGIAFREGLRRHNERKALRLEELKKRPEHIEARAFIDDLEPSENIRDQAMTAYLDALADPTLEDPISGEYDFDKRDRLVGIVEDQYGKKIIADIQEFFDRNDHPLEKELNRIRKILRPYWEAGSDIPGLSAEGKAVWDQYLKANEAGRRQMDQNPIIKAIKPIRDELRRRMRFQNDEIEAALVIWYGRVPMTQAGVDAQRGLQAPSSPTRSLDDALRDRGGQGTGGRTLEEALRQR